MAKKKPVYEFTLDDDNDNDDLDAVVSDDEAKELLIEQCMTDISEILAGAYEDINTKVRTLIEDLEQ